MRILIYGINFSPELTGIGKYTGEMVALLTEMGHEIRVVTAVPYYPNWGTSAGYSQWRYSSETIQGTRVSRCPLWVPRNPNGPRRLLHLASFALSSSVRLVAQARWQPQAVLLVAPTLFCAPAAWVVARLSGARSWLHIQDFELDAAVGLGLFRKNWLRSLAECFERFWLQRFDRVSTISDAMLARLALKGVADNRRVLFPNWVDTRVIYPLANPSAFRSELKLPANAVVALYAGAMGEKQGLEIVLDSARRLTAESRLIFVLAGAGSSRTRLEGMSRSMTNVRWLPVQPTDRLNDLLNLANIHLLPQHAGAADLVMPSKLTGMLASGRPIVATATPGTELANIVVKFGAVTPPGDIDSFAAAILRFVGDSTARTDYGARARQYAETHLDYVATVQRFERELVRISL